MPDNDAVIKLISKYVLEIVASPQTAVKDIALMFDDAGINYCVIGAVAMGIHNYLRNTDDIDILVDRKGFDIISEELIGRGFTWRKGSKRNLLYHAPFGKIKVDIIVEGDNKSGVVLPSPVDIRIKVSNIWYINLLALIEVKVSGGFEYGRESDWPDVIRLIKANDLPSGFLDFVSTIRNANKYDELWTVANTEI